MRMRILIAICGAAGFFMASGPALAGTKDDLQDLQTRMAAVEQAMAAQSAANVRISELESEIQDLTGQIEELTYRLDLANQRLDAISAALAGDTLGANAAVSGDSRPGPARGPVDLSTGDPIADQINNSTTPTRAAGSADEDISLPLDPNAAFDYASKFLLKGDYKRAKAAFKLYVEAFPHHARTPDAQFRLGEIHLALGENADAADLFINYIRNYPNDPRAAEAYLKLGTAFSRLEKPKEACTVFKTMKTKFPNAPSAVMQRADLEMTRIDCK